MTNLFNISEVETRIAEIMQRTQGMDPQKLLRGDEFLALDKNFDSLSMVEVQLLIEETFDIEFDQKAFSNASEMPRNLQQLSKTVQDELLRASAVSNVAT